MKTDPPSIRPTRAFAPRGERSLKPQGIGALEQRPRANGPILRVSGGADDEPEPAAPLTDAWLRALCIDLMGRPPLPKERAEWLGRQRKEFITAVLQTEECWAHWLREQLYYFMLIDQFRPVKTSLDEIPALLADRTITARYALHRIGLSSSFDQRNPGADTFVTVVMEQFCGIEVQRATRELELGKTAYDGSPGLFLGSMANNQSDVVRIAVRHKDAARHLLEREHLRLCRAALPRKARGKLTRKLHESPELFFELFEEWLHSEPYAARVEEGAPVENHVWVRMVFLDLSGKLPSSGDVEALRSALDGLGDPAPLRSAIVRMLLSSEGTRAPALSELKAVGNWVDGLFARLLGRAPSPQERTAFIAAAKAGDTGPETVLYTLMTSSEYDNP